MSFGEKLRQLRRQRGWSQDELGSKVEIHGRHIGKYENDQVMPNADTLVKIAKVFDVSVDYLLFDSKEPKRETLQDPELLKCFEELSRMEDQDKAVIKSLVEAYVKKRKVEAIMAR
jgi:transcriptional regulator with XRE-family HTH domain